MANRYANLVGTNRISEEYEKINEGFDQVQQDMDAAQSAADDVAAELTDHEADDVRHLTAGDRDKLASIERGAQVNQNAFAKVNGLEANNPLDSFTIAAGTGITVSINQVTKTINITATGEATPGPHGSSHLEDGADPIPLATETDGGLMSATDKAKLNRTLAAPITWADLE